MSAIRVGFPRTWAAACDPEESSGVLIRLPQSRRPELCPCSACALRVRNGRGATCDLRPRGHSLANHPCSPYSEPYGSLSSPPRRNVRRALRCHPARRAGAARGLRRLDHRPCPTVSHDPHGHEEARQHPGAGGARDYGESRARTNLHARTTPAGRRGRLDRAAPRTLERALRRAGQACRSLETQGEGRCPKQKKVVPPPPTAPLWSASPTTNSS